MTQYDEISQEWEAFVNLALERAKEERVQQ